MFSNDFIKELQKIQSQSIGDDGYKFIEIFENKFMKEKKLFKSYPDGSNSYYFDINFCDIDNTLNNLDIIKYEYFEKYIKDIIKQMEEHGFEVVRTINGINSNRMTFNIDEEYHYDNITDIVTVRFFFRF